MLCGVVGESGVCALLHSDSVHGFFPLVSYALYPSLSQVSYKLSPRIYLVSH